MSNSFLVMGRLLPNQMGWTSYLKIYILEKTAKKFPFLLCKEVQVQS